MTFPCQIISHPHEQHLTGRRKLYVFANCIKRVLNFFLHLEYIFVIVKRNSKFCSKKRKLLSLISFIYKQEQGKLLPTLTPKSNEHFFLIIPKQNNKFILSLNRYIYTLFDPFLIPFIIIDLLVTTIQLTSVMMTLTKQYPESTTYYRIWYIYYGPITGIAEIMPIQQYISVNFLFCQ